MERETNALADLFVGVKDVAGKAAILQKYQVYVRQSRSAVGIPPDGHRRRDSFRN